MGHHMVLVAASMKSEALLYAANRLRLKATPARARTYRQVHRRLPRGPSLAGICGRRGAGGFVEPPNRRAKPFTFRAVIEGLSAQDPNRLEGGHSRSGVRVRWDSRPASGLEPGPVISVSPPCRLKASRKGPSTSRRPWRGRPAAGSANRTRHVPGPAAFRWSFAVGFARAYRPRS